MAAKKTTKQESAGQRVVSAGQAPLHVTLTFESGSVVARVRRGDGGVLATASGETTTVKEAVELAKPWLFDERIGAWRVRGCDYRHGYLQLRDGARAGLYTVDDQAREYGVVPLKRVGKRKPRVYQREAVEAWWAADQRGQIVLPTGAGKSFVAHLAMERVGRTTLIVVPTIDLLNQWYTNTRETFGLDEVGQLGGGEHDVRPITITTYDSAYLHMARYGHRFGLVVFDECHHLPGPSYAQAAACLLAPFRLGLTATPERQDGSHERNDELIGPIVYRKRIRALSGDFLSQYETESIRVELSEAERAEYEESRATYLGFIRANRISFRSPRGWGEFVSQSSRSAEGRKAMRGYRRQRAIALGCASKIRWVEELLLRHRDDRTILFTNDNETVYALSRRLLIPAITHQTPTRERREILARFNDGTYRAVLTSRVLNEGVDVPEANVAIVLSGTSTVREHVQRLGRILRPGEGKKAMLYELIAADTVEEDVSKRRREHDAYDGAPPEAEAAPEEGEEGTEGAAEVVIGAHGTDPALHNEDGEADADD